MPEDNNWTSYVFDQKTPAHSVERLCLVALTLYMNSAGEAWPGDREIAQRMAVSREVAHRALRSLLDQGYIEIARREAHGALVYRIVPWTDDAPTVEMPARPVATTTERPAGDGLTDAQRHAIATRGPAPEGMWYTPEGSLQVDTKSPVWAAE
ncbi:MAG: Helix-turn-helix domain [Pseudomonadota bacterium]|jgi:DNA-binding transcriptional MocR family regulator